MSGTAGGAGSVGAVAGSVDETGVEVGRVVCGDCAGSVAERARPAITANRVGAKLTMWLVGRAAEEDVTHCNDALLGSVYREPPLGGRHRSSLVDTAQVAGCISTVTVTIADKDTFWRLRFERSLY